MRVVWIYYYKVLKKYILTFLMQRYNVNSVIKIKDFITRGALMAEIGSIPKPL